MSRRRIIWILYIVSCLLGWAVFLYAAWWTLRTV